MLVNNIKKTMKERPVFGVTVYSNFPQIIECLAFYGFDFAFIDAEHCPWEVTSLRESILAARFSGISPIVRVTKPDMIEIRKAFEMGAEGVIVPHVHNKSEAELCVKAGKFPPMGRRGFDMTVRSAAYGTKNDNMEYIAHTLETELIIPMAEDYEFTENLDDILSVKGIDAINFGPADYSMSTNTPSFYDLKGQSTDDVLKQIVDKAKPLGIGIMAPALPPTKDNAERLIERGVNMVIMGSDIYNIQSAFKNISDSVISKYK